MIRVTTRYTVQDMITFQRFHFLYGGLKAHLVRIGFFGAIIAALFFFCVLNDALSLVLAVAVLIVWFAFLLPAYSAASMFKREPKLNDTELVFVFREDGFSVTSTGGRIDGTSETKYVELVKAKESKRFFYLYTQKSQAYVLSKAKFAEGDVERLRALLRI